MRKILIATKNPAKVQSYKEKLENCGYNLITLKDLDKEIIIDENGSTAIENATIKAKTCFNETKIISIGIDDNLYIEGVPDEIQPGTHVRRVGGKTLTDEEMIEYYTSLVNKYGIDGKLKAKWVYGLAIYDGNKLDTYSWYKNEFYLVNKVSKVINEGYPLNSISVIPDNDKFFSEYTKEEKDALKKRYSDNKVTEFIISSLEKLN